MQQSWASKRDGNYVAGNDGNEELPDHTQREAVQMLLVSSSTDNNPVLKATTLLYYNHKITSIKYAVWCSKIILVFVEKIIMNFACALHYIAAPWQGQFTPSGSGLLWTQCL